MLLFNGKPLVWVTGNPNKVSNLNTTLEQEGLEGLLSVDYDCREVLASPATIARAKAMMAYAAVVPEKFEEGTNIMVEDTSLDILGAMDWDPTLIKHNIPRLPDFIGHQALWMSCIAVCDGKRASYTMARVQGVICAKVPGGFGFDPYFIPHGSTVTFGQNPAAKFNPRFLALKKFLEEGHRSSPIDYDPKFEKNWTGSWQ
jgi:inosine/xanthosine triphosphate pyrophosphatase family protein